MGLELIHGTEIDQYGLNSSLWSVNFEVPDADAHDCLTFWYNHAPNVSI